MYAHVASCINTSSGAIPRRFPRPIPLPPQPSLAIGRTIRGGRARCRAARPADIKWRMTMPLIEVHLIENVFNPTQKKQMIEKLTDAMVSIEGENMRSVTWVKISEVASGQWGIG